ncbi:spermidine synthase [Nocardioides sp. AN3]
MAPDDESTREVARATSARGELVLRRRADGSLELRANGVFVMDTVETSTERALATRALELHADPATVLVGGLGLGFTLGAVLADGRVQWVAVVEIEQALVDWMQEGIVPGRELLADPRVTVTVGDVALALRESAGSTYDLVLLDVDNGPGYLVHDANADLYEAPALEQAMRVTRPGGTVVVWSAAAAPALEATMQRVFGRWRTEALAFEVDLQGRAETYWLYAGHV